MKVKAQKAARKLVSAINAEKRSVTKPYDTQGTVQRVEGSTAYIKFTGGKRETPVRMTISCKPGDTVQIRVADKSAWITGNLSAPPTDDKQAEAAKRSAASAQAFAEEVKTVADEAHKIAGDSAQYFWHTASGSDTGAHITMIPREDFLADPTNGGPNLLARANGVAIRDGVNELATFSADGLELFRNGTSVAEFGSVARIGKLSGSHLLLYDALAAFVEGDTVNLAISGSTIHFYSNNTDRGEIAADNGGGLHISTSGNKPLRLVCSSVEIPKFKMDNYGYSDLFHVESVTVFSSTTIAAGDVESGTKSVNLGSSSGLEILGIIGYTTDSGDINVAKLYNGGGGGYGYKTEITYNVKNLGSVSRNTGLVVNLLCVKVGA